jgi:hypothetical protein
MAQGIGHFLPKGARLQILYLILHLPLPHLLINVDDINGYGYNQLQLSLSVSLDLLESLHVLDAFVLVHFN